MFRSRCQHAAARIGRHLPGLALGLLAAAPLLAGAAAADPWTRGVQVMQAFFTGPFARGISLIACVIGGALYAVDEGGGSKKRVGSLVFGCGLMLLAAQFLTWLFGITF